VLVALLANEPESDDVGRQFAAWAEAGIELHAPSLARYEIANALTRKTAHGEIHSEPATTLNLRPKPAARLDPRP
jgi:predicted nucleic acid-binding protein